MKLGTTELLVILAIVVLLFGPTQIPKLSRMLGKSVKNFRTGLDKEEQQSEEQQNDNTEQ